MSISQHIQLLLFLTPAAAVACSTDDGGGARSASETPEPDDARAPDGNDGLAPPPAGAERVTITMDQFELAPGEEAYRCQAFRNPFGRDVAIVQTQAAISPGSHHMLVFSVDQSEDAPLEECSGLEFHPTLHVAQTPTSQTTYPPGVGASYPATRGIRLNAHYLNATDAPIRPHVEVVFDAVDPSAVSQLAASIILNDASIRVPPGGGTAGGSLTLPPEVGTINLLSVQSHMHRHGVHFEFSADGAPPLYETDSWDEPPARVYSPAVTLRAGASLAWRCQIQNDGTETITFGESAATNEMCTTTGTYFPAPNGQGLIGDVILGEISLAQ